MPPQGTPRCTAARRRRWPRRSRPPGPWPAARTPTRGCRPGRRRPPRRARRSPRTDPDPGQGERHAEHQQHRPGHGEQQVGDPERGDTGRGDQERTALSETVRQATRREGRQRGRDVVDDIQPDRQLRRRVQARSVLEQVRGPQNQQRGRDVPDLEQREADHDAAEPATKHRPNLEAELASLGDLRQPGPVRTTTVRCRPQRSPRCRRRA